MHASYELDTLRRECNLGAKFWNRAFAGLLMTTQRMHGPAMLDRLWGTMLSRHQERFFLSGLRKLGLDREPPAVAAAKYHYFSNLIGGLPMQYIEESPQKVWIRYLAPAWSYPGTTLHALPLGIRRTVMSTWHPKNGEALGCLGLGWVCTKLIDEGDPYDEGYFIEEARALAPHERGRFIVVERTPEYDPSLAPVLDPDVWPQTRLLRAQRNYAGSYIADTIDTLYSLIGGFPTHMVIAHTMRVLAAQYAGEIAADLGIENTTAEAIASLYFGLLTACGEEARMERLQTGTLRIDIIGTRKPFREAHEPLLSAWFEFQTTVAKVMNGRVSVSRESLRQGERWTVEDTGRWLW